MKLSRTSISVDLFHVQCSKIYSVLNLGSFKFHPVALSFLRISLYQSSFYWCSLYRSAVPHI